MCDQIGPQNKPVMSLEKLALDIQALRVARKATQILRCSNRCRKGINKSECLCIKFFWGLLRRAWHYHLHMKRHVKDTVSGTYLWRQAE